MRDDCTDYRDLFLHDRAMMDTRAPVEFHKGAFPGVINLPLMTDIERQKVGTCYKQQGQQAAIELGHQLVSGQTKAERIEMLRRLDAAVQVDVGLRALRDAAARFWGRGEVVALDERHGAAGPCERGGLVVLRG